jgi:hypothetical protein
METVPLHNKKKLYSPLQQRRAAKFMDIYSYTNSFTALLPKIRLPKEITVLHVC